MTQQREVQQGGKVGWWGEIFRGLVVENETEVQEKGAESEEGEEEIKTQET